MSIKQTTATRKKSLTDLEAKKEKIQDSTKFINRDQTKELEIISWLKQPSSEEIWPVPNLPGMPKLEEGSIYSKAPTLGEHTKQIMLNHGYRTHEINKLIKDGVIA